MKSEWDVKPLGELCQVEFGKTPARKDPKNWDANKHTDNVWLSIADLPRGFNPVVCDSKEYVSNKAVPSMKIVPKGTLMVSFKLTLGRVAIAGRDLFTNEAIAAILNLDETKLRRDYLLWAFRGFDWESAAAGDEKVKGKTLNKSKLKQLLIPIPPLKEQRRIVAVLDKTFAKIESMEQEYKKQLSDIKELRQSLLQKASAGELS